MGTEEQAEGRGEEQAGDPGKGHGADPVLLPAQMGELREDRRPVGRPQAEHRIHPPQMGVGTGRGKAPTGLVTAPQRPRAWRAGRRPG